MYADNSEWSQASERDFRVFRDQHGRKWGADIEKKTGHPCGPMSLRTKASEQYPAPLNVPEQYKRVTNAASGEFEILYDVWIDHLRQAHEEYDLHALEESVKMFGDKGAEQLEKRDPALIRRIGEAPERIERVLAAKSGNRWVLGLPNPKTGLPEAKPSWAELYFPAPVAVKMQEFPNADEEFADAPAEEAAYDAPESFPHMYRPGMWYLSSEHFDEVIAGREKGFKGNGEAARQAAELRGDAVPAGAHESWGG